MDDAYKIGLLVGRSQRKNHVDERIILKLILEK
jgi:hypothetical protein